MESSSDAGKSSKDAKKRVKKLSQVLQDNDKCKKGFHGFLNVATVCKFKINLASHSFKQLLVTENKELIWKTNLQSKIRIKKNYTPLKTRFDLSKKNYFVISTLKKSS